MILLRTTGRAVRTYVRTVSCRIPYIRCIDYEPLLVLRCMESFGGFCGAHYIDAAFFESRSQDHEILY